jgi:hypothetical protein
MPEQPTDLIRPEPFTEDELAKARELRAKLAHILPDDFNNDFFFGRFVRAYRNHEDAIEQKIKELISHRNILGYNASNIVEFCETNPLAKSTFQRFAISHFSMNVFSGDIAVFVQKMEGCDIKEITKVLPLSTVLHSYYFLQTCFLRTIHEHERKTGRPAAVVVILDLQGLNLMDFINPLSVSSKLARLVVKIWSDYFSENLIRLILLHPPAM